MGGILAPLVVVVVTTLGIWSVYENNWHRVTPTKSTLQIGVDATAFLAYRAAIISYMQLNPNFTGSIPSTSLAGQFSASFLAESGNYVSAFGTAGRQITCWSAASTGTVQQAVTQGGVDFSIGTTNGSTWVSAAPGAVTTPVVLDVGALSVTPKIQAGDIVSVIQTGS